MPAALNSACFEQPHWRVIASGFQTESWFNDGQAVGSGGILNPQRIHLLTGQYYYRFASSSAPRMTQLGGGWWLDFENFKLVDTFSQRHGYSLRDAARLMLALPYAWTRVDLLIRVLLRQPLKAYSGEGKPAQSAGTAVDRKGTWIPTQHIKVRQLYIPGLCIRATDSPKAGMLFETAFAWPGEVTSLLKSRAGAHPISA